MKKEKVLNFLIDEKTKSMKPKEVAILLQVPNGENKILFKIIDELVSDGKLVKTKKGKITTLEKASLHKGTFLSSGKGFGFVRLEDRNVKDIFVPPNATYGAVHRDSVLCRITDKGFGSKKDEGAIYTILKRGYNMIVGLYCKGKYTDYITPDDMKFRERIYIKKKDSMGAVPGHKVLVKILYDKTKATKSDNDERKRLKGEVTEIIGHVNDPGVDILSILNQYEIPIKFPDEVLNESNTTKTEVTEEEYSDRVDLRSLTTITIDGEDTKDVDDAISLSILENGNYSLGVHIADVTHYVIENSNLDKEAYKRGTSAYLVDRVVPMLPHKLSNGICSLDENVDRLALSCEMEIDRKGQVVGHKIFTSVINVSKRATYTAVNDVIENAEQGKYFEEYLDYVNIFKDMQKLSITLRKKRIERGTIEFDFPEAKILLDEEGYPIDVLLYERNKATKIIEEFMLVCNETIAEEYFWLGYPFLFRTHEEPDAEKVSLLVDFIKNFGYKIKGNISHPKNMQRLLEEIKGTPEETIIPRIILRSLKQARYTEINAGHFGLAAKYYCHFTAPIRRYPDLQIHRIIKENIRKGLTTERLSYLSRNMPEVARHCSITERKAEEAEREVDTLKKVEFMQDKIGEVFEGIVSSTMSWGMYVTLPNTIEGMVDMTLLPDDKYIFNEQRMMYVGQKYGETYSLGDKVKVMLVAASKESRRIDFTIYFPEDDEE